MWPKLSVIRRTGQMTPEVNGAAVAVPSPTLCVKVARNLSRWAVVTIRLRQAAKLIQTGLRNVSAGGSFRYPR